MGRGQKSEPEGTEERRGHGEGEFGFAATPSWVTRPPRTGEDSTHDGEAPFGNDKRSDGQRRKPIQGFWLRQNDARAGNDKGRSRFPSGKTSEGAWLGKMRRLRF